MNNLSFRTTFQNIQQDATYIMLASCLAGTLETNGIRPTSKHGGYLNTFRRKVSCRLTNDSNDNAPPNKNLETTNSENSEESTSSSNFSSSSSNVAISLVNKIVPVRSNSLQPSSSDDDDANNNNNVTSRRKRIKKMLINFKDDIEHMCSRVHVGFNIKDRMRQHRKRRSSSNTSTIKCDGRLIIILAANDTCKDKHSNNSFNNSFDEGADMPDHNFSPNLVMKPLQDGLFEASMPLDHFPDNHNIIVLVQNNKLIICLQNHRNQSNSRHHITRPYRCGDVDLPYYVDMETLSFSLEGDHTLVVIARTQFALRRNRSVSTTDLYEQVRGKRVVSTKPVLESFASLAVTEKRLLKELMRSRCHSA